MEKRIIICISRQFGSGGHLVGELLAKRLGIPYYDKELLSLTADEHNVSEAVVKAVDEKPVTWSMLGFPHGLRNPYQPKIDDGLYYVLNDSIFYMQAETIKRIAAEGSCVIVGRAGEEILKEDPDMVSIFIHGTFDDRVQRTMTVDKIEEQSKAEQRVRKMDKKRASYHNYYSNCKWGEADSYHLSISTSLFGIEGAAEAIERVISGMK